MLGAVVGIIAAVVIRQVLAAFASASTSSPRC
jgi:hypothetical protein